MCLSHLCLSASPKARETLWPGAENYLLLPLINGENTHLVKPKETAQGERENRDSAKRGLQETGSGSLHVLLWNERNNKTLIRNSRC